MSRNVIGIVNIERKEIITTTTTNWNNIWEKEMKIKTTETRIEKLWVHVTEECFWKKQTHKKERSQTQLERK